MLLMILKNCPASVLLAGCADEKPLRMVLLAMQAVE